jgi:hypothetical protein
MDSDTFHRAAARIAKASGSGVSRRYSPVAFPRHPADVFAAVLVDVAGI